MFLQGGARGTQSVFDVFMALANHLQISVSTRALHRASFGALNHTRHGLAVTHHVQLKPKRRGGVLGNVFDGADAHGRQVKGMPNFSAARAA